jgi:hypothetical protein
MKPVHLHSVTLIAELKKKNTKTASVLKLCVGLHKALSVSYERKQRLPITDIKDIMKVDKALVKAGWGPIFEDWYGAWETAESLNDAIKNGITEELARPDLFPM